MRIGGVAAELVEQEVRVEHVDAHARERHVGPSPHRRRLLRLFNKRADEIVGVDMHDPERGRLAERNLEAADGHVGGLLHMLREHLFVVHLVDVIARQDDDVFRRVALDDVDVLIDRVRRPGVPRPVRHALARGQDVEALVALVAEEIPAALQMPDEAVRLVLGGDADAADAGIERIGEGEIDDARLAAEMHRGLGPPIRELEQPGAAAAGEHIRHRRTCKRCA